jgi:hypothetical protein
MKILIISQHLFPMQTPRAHRTTELLKEFGRRGHEVCLYAVLGKFDYSGFESEFKVKVRPIPIKWMLHPYNSDNDQKRKLIDQVLGRMLRKLEFPNLELRWRVEEILEKEHDYDALITIADPHQIHWGAAKYRKRHPEKFPGVWIADCGDPFMLNGANSGHLKFFERFERDFCEMCDVITVPAEQAKLGYYQEYRNKIEVIPQGFNFEMDRELSEPVNPVRTFAYAGTFYKDIRNPKAFLEYLTSKEIDFKFEVFSPHNDQITTFKSLLGDRLVLRKPLPRTALIEELKTKDFLVNFENVNSPAQVPSKLIDYAICGRPILSVNPIRPDFSNIDRFLEGDYSGQYTFENLEQYHISNVAQRFVDLIAFYTKTPSKKD